MKTEPKPLMRREVKAQAIIVGAGVVGLLIGGGGAMLEATEITVPAPAMAAGAFVLIAALIWVSLLYWRLIDEAAKEAHKFAWYWGGCAALLLAFPAMLLANDETLVAVFGPRGPVDWVVGGMQAVIVTQLVGYGVAWVGWWLARQR